MAELTVYSTASDGGAWTSNNVDWDTAHDAANADVIRANQVSEYLMTNTDFDCRRIFLYFLTSALGAGATISAATLFLYGRAKSRVDATHPDIGIVEGVQGDPFDAADFGDHLLKTTLGADTYFDYDTFLVDLVNPAENSKALNATGIGWINKTGTTKLCLRNYGDIEDLEPNGNNNIEIWLNEKGAGFIPKLVITYTPPAVVGRSQGYIIGQSKTHLR